MLFDRSFLLIETNAVVVVVVDSVGCCCRHWYVAAASLHLADGPSIGLKPVVFVRMALHR